MSPAKYISENWGAGKHTDTPIATLPYPHTQPAGQAARQFFAQDCLVSKQIFLCRTFAATA